MHLDKELSRLENSLENGHLHLKPTSIPGSSRSLNHQVLVSDKRQIHCPGIEVDLEPAGSTSLEDEEGVNVDSPLSHYPM